MVLLHLNRRVVASAGAAAVLRGCTTVHVGTTSAISLWLTGFVCHRRLTSADLAAGSMQLLVFTALPQNPITCAFAVPARDCKQGVGFVRPAGFGHRITIGPSRGLYQRPVNVIGEKRSW